ncbi:MAG: AzlD domain-containing protein [Alphaproteobacteria bacterium]
MSFSYEAVLTILGMASVTWLTRASGFWLVRRVVIEGRLKAALESAPPAILTGIVAPIVFLQGPAEAAGVVVTALASLKLPTLAAVVLGVAVVAGLRLVLSF